MGEGFELVRYVWCDASGIRRCRVVPKRVLEEYNSLREQDPTISFDPNGPRLCKSCVFLPCYGDVGLNIPDLIGPCGEVLLTPCLDNAPFIPAGVLPSHCPTSAQARYGAHSPLGNSGTHLDLTDEIRLVEFVNEDGTPYEYCPRFMLKNALKYLENVFGLELIVGWETEFCLLQKSGQDHLTPIDTSVYCQSNAFDTVSHIMKEMCMKLESIGQCIRQVHGESSPGQFEIVTQHGGALEQADHYILRKEIVSSTAHKYGMVVSFLPKPFDNQAGSASHCHLSLRSCESGQSVMTDSDSLPSVSASYMLSDVSKRFLSGIVRHLGACLPFTAGNLNSFDRIVPSSWSGAYSCWGENNKEAAVRLVGIRADAVNAEYKAFDGTANPYLGLCAIVVAGVCGLEDPNGAAALPEPLPPVDPVILTQEERAACMAYRLPESLSASLETLNSDKGFTHTLQQVCQCSAGFVQLYSAMKQSDIRHFDGMSVDELRKMLYDRF